MSGTIDFYFDFSSPYGYLGSHRIEPLAARHGREVLWHPILLGAAFKLTGSRPLTEQPIRKDYFERDFPRSARFYGISYKHPSVFPVSTVSACRAFYSVSDKGKAVQLAKALYKAFFADDVNISEAENVIRVASSVGCDVRAALSDQAVKDRTKAEVDAAIAKGVFGSPYVIAGGEPFWGVDRFDQLERWLATGGF